VLKDGLSRACRAHAEYVVRNLEDPGFRRIGPHREDSKLPGYTPEGADTAQASVINLTSTSYLPEQFDPRGVFAIDNLIGTFFHRVPLLHPQLRHVGYGTYRGQKGRVNNYVTVIDIRDSRRKDLERGWVVLYPGDRQNEVPTTFLNTEHPSPTPAEGVGKKLGYCVTATFAPTVRVQDAQATLQVVDAAPLDAWVSTPTQPATDRGLQMNTVCIIAKKPLQPRTTYTATVTATVDGKPFERAWRFTTAKQ
jgi:hypothetical protein